MFSVSLCGKRYKFSQNPEDQPKTPTWTRRNYNKLMVSSRRSLVPYVSHFKPGRVHPSFSASCATILSQGPRKNTSNSSGWPTSSKLINTWGTVGGRRRGSLQTGSTLREDPMTINKSISFFLTLTSLVDIVRNV